MKNISLLFISLFITFCATAQETKVQIKLRNNSVIKGRIIEKLDSVSIKIETDKSRVVVIPWKEIVAINDFNKKEEKVVNKEMRQNNQLRKQLDRGVIAYLSLPCFQYYNDNSAGMSGHFEMGYQFNPKFQLLVGLGAEGDWDFGRRMTTFVDFRYNILARKTTPFVFFKPGYALRTVINSSLVNGFGAPIFYDSSIRPSAIGSRNEFYCMLGVGYKVKVQPHFSLNFHVGYRLRYSPGGTYLYGNLRPVTTNFNTYAFSKSSTMLHGVEAGFSFGF